MLLGGLVLDLMLMLGAEIFLLFESILFPSSFLVTVIASCRKQDTIAELYWIQVGQVLVYTSNFLNIASWSQIDVHWGHLIGDMRQLLKETQIRKIIGCGDRKSVV